MGIEAVGLHSSGRQADWCDTTHESRKGALFYNNLASFTRAAEENCTFRGHISTAQHKYGACVSGFGAQTKGWAITNIEGPHVAVSGSFGGVVGLSRSRCEVPRLG